MRLSFLCVLLMVPLESVYGLNLFGDMDFFLCDDEVQAKKCVGCRKEGSVNFRVDKDKSFVLIQYKGLGTDTLSNCKIVNNKNWDCSKRDASENLISVKRQYMQDGIFTYISYLSTVKVERLTPTYACAR